MGRRRVTAVPRPFRGASGRIACACRRRGEDGRSGWLPRTCRRGSLAGQRRADPACGAGIRGGGVPGGDFDSASEHFCHACYAATGGNPLLLHSLVAALAAEGIEPTDEAAGRVTRYGAETSPASSPDGWPCFRPGRTPSFARSPFSVEAVRSDTWRTWPRSTSNAQPASPTRCVPGPSWRRRWNSTSPTRSSVSPPSRRWGRTSGRSLTRGRRSC